MHYYEHGRMLADLLRETIGMQHFDRAIRCCTLLLDTADVPGDVVEFGCNEGRTSLLLSHLIQPPKRLWVYDSFQGLPEVNPAEGVDSEYRRGRFRVEQTALYERFAKAGQPAPEVYPGWFADIRPEQLPPAISFALVDGDLYSSVTEALDLVHPRMSPGGIVIVDDTGHPGLPGAAAATMDFLSRHDEYTLVKPHGIGEMSYHWYLLK